MKRYCFTRTFNSVQPVWVTARSAAEARRRLEQDDLTYDGDEGVDASVEGCATFGELMHTQRGLLRDHQHDEDL